MPNPDLAPFLVDVVTRRRLTQQSVGGQTRNRHTDVLGVEAGIRAERGGFVQGIFTQAPRGQFTVTLHPDADVLQGDLLLPTRGFYVGRVFKVMFVQGHTLLPHLKADVDELPEMPLSTAA